MELGENNMPPEMRELAEKVNRLESDDQAMRIALGDDVKKWLKRVLIGAVILSFAMTAHEVIKAVRSGDDPGLLFDGIAAVLFPLLVFCIVLLFPERVIDETGVTEYGFFGKIRMRHMSWDEMAFVGSVIIMAGKDYTTPVRMIVCGKAPPRKLYSNSRHFREPKGKHINLPDNPEVRARVLQFVGDRFEIWEENAPL